MNFNKTKLYWKNKQKLKYLYIWNIQEYYHKINFLWLNPLNCFYVKDFKELFYLEDIYNKLEIPYILI